MPHEVAETRQWAHVARVDAVVKLARYQRNGLCLTGGLVRIAVQIVVAVVGGGWGVVRRRGGVIEYHVVVAGEQIGKAVKAVHIRERRLQQHIGGRVEETDFHVFNARLARILNAVLIQIVPHEITETR